MEPPPKRQKKVLFGDSSSDEESGDESGGVNLVQGDSGFKINEEYARRFEYNKKREELQKLEDKLGQTSTFQNKAKSSQNVDNEEGSSSESEDEDDEGVLATEAVDSEISATLNAIRSKDPRVYDSKTTFYHSIDDNEGVQGTDTTAKQTKPMFLRDYHRENLLSAVNGNGEESDTPKTYAQEQDDLKRSIVKEMHAAADDDGEDDGEDDEGDDEAGFLVRKPNQDKPSTTAKKISDVDVATADKDPENFLSNFMSSRAWVPTDRTNFQPFESDDDEEDERAEALEEAYNFRFEDPNKINEALTTHARDTTSKFSVRREEPSSRKKKRDTERARKEEEKKEREAERARLRKLKIEELEEKVSKIKQAAGIKASDITDEEWARFLDEGWDDSKWEVEMKKRFGEEYYAMNEGTEDEEGEGKSKKKKPKKPRWDDDIDIKDLVPDFDDEDEVAGGGGGDGDEEMEDEDDESKPNKKKDRLREKRDKQKEARKDRRRIEQVVDQNLDLDTALLPGSSKKFSGQFRYRESSPVSFGLTARDILMAEDSHLNKHAGLKKLASFRDPVKKKRDKKHLGKKARLRQWRQETFGDENGPPMEFPEPSQNKHVEAAPDDSGAAMDVDIREGKKKKRKRQKKH